MADMDIYTQMAQRTDGNIYVGVVGPVRTGKSTFIRRFMDLMVLPEMADSWQKERLVDELPQSGGGRTIMTTQISFVPSDAVEIDLAENARCSVRMVDCVGYMVEGAYGDSEDGQPRMVRTPWQQEEVSFVQAAEQGTRKVITDHSTIGLVVTTDGTITDIPRANYLPAEERAVDELKALGKPFILLLNSRAPEAPHTREMANNLSTKYAVPVVPVDALNMDRLNVQEIMRTVLYEFPIRQVNFNLPTWVRSLPWGHWLLTFLIELLKEIANNVGKVKDYQVLAARFAGAENIDELRILNIDAGNGVVEADIVPQQSLYYKLLSEESGLQIDDEASLMSIIYDLAHAKREYDHMAEALEAVRAEGYGHVRPGLNDIELEEPEMFRQGGSWGVRFRATAPSWHILRVDVGTEVTQIVGNEKQTEDFLRHLRNDYETDKEALWNTSFFGQTLYSMVGEGMEGKSGQMPPAAQARLRNVLNRMVNDGKNNLICIVF